MLCSQPTYNCKYEVNRELHTSTTIKDRIDPKFEQQAITIYRRRKSRGETWKDLRQFEGDGGTTIQYPRILETRGSRQSFSGNSQACNANAIRTRPKFMPKISNSMTPYLCTSSSSSFFLSLFLTGGRERRRGSGRFGPVALTWAVERKWAIYRITPIFVFFYLIAFLFFKISNHVPCLPAIYLFIIIIIICMWNSLSS